MELLHGYHVHQTSLQWIFFVGKLKQTVYNERPTTPEDMRNRIVRAVAAVDSETIERSLQSLVTRQCIIVEQYFEHLLVKFK